MAVSFRRKLVLIGLFGLFAAGCASVAEDTTASDSVAAEETTTTTEPVEEKTTTTEPVEETTTTELAQEETTTTTTAVEPSEAAEAEVCTDESFSSITFEPIPPFDCQTIYDTTVAILLQNGWDAPPPQSGIFLEVGILCTLTSESTYQPESTHVPAIADAVMGVMCDADRSLLVPAA